MYVHRYTCIKCKSFPKLFWPKSSFIESIPEVDDGVAQTIEFRPVQVGWKLVRRVLQREHGANVGQHRAAQIVK
jgi:hypothetical protein